MHKQPQTVLDYLSGISGRNWQTVSFVLLAALMLFPALDYIVRRVLEIPVFSSLWDELVLLAGLVLALAQWLQNKDRQPGRWFNQVILIFFLFGVAMLVVDLSTFAINVEGFRAVYQYTLFFYIGYFLTQNYRQMRFLITIAFVIGTLIGLHGIYQYIADVPMPGRWVDSAEDVRTRAFSIIGSPNVLGSHMAMLVPIGLGLFMSEKNKLFKWLLLAGTGVIAICLVVTLSRGAWLALIGALGIMGIFYDKRVLAVGLIAVILAGIFVPAVNQRMGYLLSAEYMEKSSESGRIKRWLTAYDQMRQDPLFGVGLGHFGGAVAKRHFNSVSVDSYYMGVVAEMGLIGLGLFLYLIFIALKKGFNAWKSLREPSYRYFAASLLAGLLVIALHNAVENIFEVPYLTVYFWVIAGFLAALPHSVNDGGDSFAAR